MRRPLFTTLFLISLLLCLAIPTLWIRSYWVSDMLTFRLDQAGLGLATVRGQFLVARIVTDDPNDLAGVQTGYTRRPPEHLDDATTPRWSMLGLRYYRQTIGAAFYDHLRVSFLYPFLATLALTLLAFRLRKPRPAGLCINCGYDLRATPERCPECGRTADLPQT